MEPFYPLRVFVCAQCFLVQLEEFETPDHIFTDYAYFSSYSTSWLEHSRRYAEQMIERFGSGRARATSSSWRPTTATCCSTSTSGRCRCSASSRRRTWPRSRFAEGDSHAGGVLRPRDCAASLARDSAADLLIGNNVLAHVPDLNDFVAGMKMLLKPGGVITMEFPHLMRLVDQNQFDTIYHEHFSYFSFLTVEPRVRARTGCRLFDVERAADTRRLAADLRLPRRRRTTSPRPSGRRSSPPASARPGYETAGTYELRAAGRGGEAVDPLLPHRAQDARGSHDRRLRRAGQGQHAAELLRRRHGLHRLHGRHEPPQAGASAARKPHPDPLARRDPRDASPTCC